MSGENNRITRRKYIKYAAGVIAAAAAATVAGGYYYATAPRPKKVIRFMSGWTFEQTSKPLQDLVDEYNSLNPDVTVELYLVEWTQGPAKYAAMKAAGTPVDFGDFNETVGIALLGNGEVKPVNDVMKALGEDQYFYPWALKLAKYGTKDYLWIPDHTSTLHLMYRKDIFDQKGLKVPKTWPELLETAKALHQPPTRYGIGFPMSRTYIPASFALSAFFWCNGGTLFDDKGNCVLDSPQNIEGLNFFKELSKYMPPGVSNWGFSEMKEAWYNQVVGMQFYSSLACLDTVYTVKPEIAKATGLASLPIGPHGQQALHREGGSGIYVFKSTKYDEEIKKFLVWWFKPENWFRGVKNMPLYFDPVTPLIWNMKEWQALPPIRDLPDQLKMYSGEINSKALQEALENPVLGLNPKVNDVLTGLQLTDCLQEIILGNAPVEPTLQKYKAKIMQSVAQ